MQPVVAPPLLLASLGLLGVVQAALLPSYHAADHRQQGQLHDSKWWVHVGDHVFYQPPASMTSLSQQVGDYYYALGSAAGVPEALKDRRVGGDGRWHIFHLPEGVSLLQASAASVVSSTSGDRRASLSALKRLSHGIVLSSTFPAYDRSANYRYPLGSSGLATEKSAVAAITPDRIMSFLTNLTNLVRSDQHKSRSWTDETATEHSTAFLQRQFSAMGITNCLQGFQSDGKKLGNVIAHIPGRTLDSVTVGAHYDSRPYDGNAPGAEDNGSGVAALLAIAKAFSASGLQPTKNIYFVGFAAEEPGLKGSAFFASKLASRSLPSECQPRASFLQAAALPQMRREGRHSAIVLDEVGWRSPNLAQPTVNLESYDWTRDVMEHLAQASEMHNGQAIEVVHSNNPFGSDHMSFLDKDIPAVLTINGDDEGYPNYHKSTDTIENVDPQFVTHISRMVLGATMRLAGVRSAASA